MDESTTAKRLYKSAAAATLSQFWRIGVAFGARIVLRRLVGPEDWGLWDWVLPIFLILGAVRDLGIVYHVVRIKNPRPYGNLLAVEILWGGLLALGVFVGAPLFALGYSQAHAEIIPVIQALTLFLIFEGLSSVPRVYFECELQVGRAVPAEILRNLLFATLSVVLALLGHGVWSMVIAHVVSSAVFAAHLWLKAYKTLPLHWERGATLSILKGSLPLALIWFLIVLTRHIDPLILAKRFDFETVGNYVFAYELAFLVVTILQPAVGRALYPALAALADKPRKMFEAYRLGTLLISAIEVPAALFLFINAELVVRILGGGEWVDTPTYLRILALAPLIDPFTRLGGEFLKNRQGDWIWIVATATTLLSFSAVGFVSTAHFGPIGMAWTNFLPFGVLWMIWGVRRIDPVAFGRLLRDLLWIYLPPLLPFALAWLAAPHQPMLRFALSIAAAGLSAAFYYRRFGVDFMVFLKGPAEVAEMQGPQPESG